MRIAFCALMQPVLLNHILTGGTKMQEFFFDRLKNSESVPLGPMG